MFAPLSGRAASALCFVLALPTLILSCTADPPSDPLRAAEAALGTDNPSGSGLAPAPIQAVTLPWGDAEGAFSLRPASQEQAAQGPSAIALTNGGIALVLDRLRGRVVAISPEGSPRTLAESPVDAEQIAVGPEGDFVLWSPLRAKAWVVSANGQEAGSVDVPRVLRDVSLISLSGSRRVRATTALQHTLDLGSPHAALDLPAILRTQREGAAFLGDGRAVAVKKSGDQAEILVFRAPPRGAATKDPTAHSDVPESGKPALEKAIPVPFRAGAQTGGARIVGVADNAVCLRIENVVSGSPVQVIREVACVDVNSAEVLLRRELPPPGLYTPQIDVAVAARPLTVAVLDPSENGLTVHRWRAEKAPAKGDEVKR